MQFTQLFFCCLPLGRSNNINSDGEDDDEESGCLRKANSLPSLTAVVRNSIRSPPTALLVFLHGLGDCGASFAPLSRLMSQRLPHLKFIFPNAYKFSSFFNSLER